MNMKKLFGNIGKKTGKAKPIDPDVQGRMHLVSSQGPSQSTK